MNTGSDEDADIVREIATLGCELEECRQRLLYIDGLFAHVAEAIFVAEPDGRIVDVNPAACSLLSYSKEELLAMHPWDFVTSASREEIVELIQGLPPAVPTTVKRTYRCKTGEEKLMDLRMTRCHLAGRDLVIVSCRDITEQRRLEDRLRRSEKNLAEGQRLTKTGSWILDFETGNTDWSVETCRIFGFPDPPPSPHYSKFRARVRPEDREGVDGGLRESFATGEPRPLKYVFILPDGTRKNIETISQPMRDDSGAVVKLMGTVMDVTERVKAQQALQQSKDHLRLVIDTIPGLVWSANPDGHIDYFNQRWIDFVGLSLEQASGWGWQTAIHPDDVPGLTASWKAMLASGQAGEAEARLRRFDGAFRWFLFRSVPLCDASGTIIKWYGQNTDIDERKRAEYLVAGEKRLLEMIAQGDALALILDSLCKLAENLTGDVLVSIMLMSSDGKRLQQGAAPSLPKRFLQSVDGVLIGPRAGSCAAAAYRKAPVFVADIATDPLWDDCRQTALGIGLRACWSTPIFATSGDVLGAFALYRRTKGVPSAYQKGIIEQLVHLASIAIERTLAQEALQASELLARGQTEALTRALDAMARESSPDKIVEQVLRNFTTQLDAQSTSVWLRDEASGLMVFEFALEDGSFRTKANAQLIRMSPSLSIDDVWPWPEVFRTGKPYLLEDIREGPEFPWRAHVLAQGVVSILTVPMLVSGVVMGVIGIQFTKTRTFREEELALSQALTNQLMLAMQLIRLSEQSREAAVIAERNRMARDIHDALAQGFTGVIVQLEAAEDATSRGLVAETQNHLARAGKMARYGLSEARRSVQALRLQGQEDRDLCSALEGLIRRATADTSLHSEFVLCGKPQSLPPEWEDNLLRIAQEGVTNALRHAKSTHFQARLHFERRTLTMEMGDNGCGFDAGQKNDGFGLMGMRERVEHMSGHISIQSAQGAGTKIIITLPLKHISQPSEP